MKTNLVWLLAKPNNDAPHREDLEKGRHDQQKQRPANSEQEDFEEIHSEGKGRR